MRFITLVTQVSSRTDHPNTHKGQTCKDLLISQREIPGENNRCHIGNTANQHTFLVLSIFFRLIDHRLNRSLKNKFFRFLEFSIMFHRSRSDRKIDFFLRIFSVNYMKIDVYFHENICLFSQK